MTILRQLSSREIPLSALLRHDDLEIGRAAATLDKRTAFARLQQALFPGMQS